VTADALPLPDLYRVVLTMRAEEYFGFPAPVPLFAAQMRQESGFRPDAVSSAGARGLFQFMPTTAAWAADSAGFKPAAPNDANWSIRAGVWYMRFLYDRVQAATPCDRWAFSLSAYNGGLGRVQQRQALSSKPLDWVTTSVVNPGIAPVNQTQNEDYPFNIIWRWQPDYRTLGRMVCT
jgi:soluble lytic murein transglycosylase-like protein